MPLLSTYKTVFPKGYSTNAYYIEDTTENSPDYFDVQDFPLAVGGGRYVIKIKGSTNLKIGSLVDVEIIDAQGQNVYTEIVPFIDRFLNRYIAFDVYDITAKGLATIYIVGEARIDQQGGLIPIREQKKFNVRWQKQFNILPFERNNGELLFDQPPQVSVAQVVVPARVATSLASSSYNYTSSITDPTLLSITSANFFGYDRDFASSEDILDARLRAITVNPKGAPKTANSVTSNIREIDQDITNGLVINYVSRFNTIIQATQSFFIKAHLGGYFEFASSASTPTELIPALPSGYTVSGSTSDQLSNYYATIVDVISDKQAVISKPINVITVDNNNISLGAYSNFTYKKASSFSGSITYVPSADLFVTSSTVSSSYVEFTFSDLRPISGQVYRIKTSAKLGSITGDYKVLNDQIIIPVEYLTDSNFSNTLNYARYESDYRLIGCFTTQSILDDYWLNMLEDSQGFDTITGSINNSTQTDSAKIQATYTQSALLTTQFNQNYNEEQTYTLGFNLTLEPYTELEVYMNSDPLSAYTITSLAYPRGFFKSTNNEKSRYGGSQNRFGKYLGKIKNDRAVQKYYGRVLFDFDTDGNGFGRPLFRSKVIDDMAGYSGSAYISDVSIKPYLLNGFTPNIVQYAVPLPTELTAAATLSQSIDFKIDYFDYTGKQSEYTTYIDDLVLNLKGDVQSNTCQDDIFIFEFVSGTDTTEVVVFTGGQ